MVWKLLILGKKFFENHLDFLANKINRAIYLGEIF